MTMPTDVEPTAEAEVRTVELPASAPEILFGPGDAQLRRVETLLEVSLGARGTRLHIRGPAERVALAEQLFTQLAELLEAGHPLAREDVETAARVLLESPQASLQEFFTSPGRVAGVERLVTPRSLRQQIYLKAMADHDLVISIGPAGTGKTYLAVAMAAAFLQEKLVRRIVLARPAVEAGERLGFLPGDIAEKVNPYLRPLFDALNDLIGFERAARLMERGIVEVAPVAFMRGRAQPVSTPVLTPTGFRPIGELEVGDLVVGSSGNATQVLGIYPQGRKPVFRVRSQDGASTLCCGEHLWRVFTASDRRRGKPGRVLETREMVGRLRSFHQHRFELPLLSAPVEFPSRDVPMDPYALGLLLGDGCLTTTTTPSFTTGDPELAWALEALLDDRIEVKHKGGPDYVLRNVEGHRGGVIVANPVTTVLRELELAGTRSSTKFVPPAYLYNTAEVRIALLQGLLDSDGGPTTQDNRSCRIGYSTSSERLRDDVLFLVRSLGGVAYWRCRPAAGRRPGHANGRPVHHRSDAYVFNIRLPAGIEPFRLARKRDIYRRHGGGRPMRFVHAIEEAGEAETVCIQVAAADSLYVTEDFLVTHNTLNDSFIILDEAQNTTSEQMKMFLTRIGFNSKAVITGDVTQVDLPPGKASGLREIESILQGVEGIQFIHFDERDVVRHRLVQRIVSAYEAYEQRRPQAAGGSPESDEEA